MALFICHLSFYHFSANLSPFSLSFFHPVSLPKHLDWTTRKLIKSRAPPWTLGQLLMSPTTWWRHRKWLRSWRRPSGIVRLEARTCVWKGCPLPRGWAVHRPPPSSTTNNWGGHRMGFGFNWGWVFLVEFEVLDFEIRTMLIGKLWHLEKRERWKEEREEKYKLLKK